MLTDHLLQRVRYAPWPLGNVMGVAVSRPSVLSHGVARYLTALARAEGEAPGTLVLPGVETSPYSRFGGSPLAGSLELQGWHRHLLVLGIDGHDAPACPSAELSLSKMLMASSRRVSSKICR